MSESTTFRVTNERKRDLRWKTFRQSVLEDKSIHFRTSPDALATNGDLLKLVDETYTCGSNILQNSSKYPSVVIDHVDWTITDAQCDLSLLASCISPQLNRFELVRNHVSCDDSFQNVLADTNPSIAHGFSTSAFEHEQAKYIPLRANIVSTAELDHAQVQRQQNVCCPYFFIEKAQNGARHDIEWAMNRCALNGYLTLQAFEQSRRRSPNSAVVEHVDDLVLLSCALSEDIAVLNYHWFADKSFLIAPICKFDLRTPAHRLKFQAWNSAIFSWAKLCLLPRIRQNLQDLVDWYEVADDPLNITAGIHTTQQEIDAMLYADQARQPDTFVQNVQSRYVPSTSDKYSPIRQTAVPATSACLFFPPSAHETTSRILSWQRETMIWQNGPRSAGLTVREFGIDASKRHIKSKYDTLSGIRDPEDFYKRIQKPKVSRTNNLRLEEERSKLTMDGRTRARKGSLLQGSINAQISHAAQSRATKDPIDIDQSVPLLMRYSHGSSATKVSSLHWSPVLQHHQINRSVYATPPSSVGTHFEEIEPPLPEEHIVQQKSADPCFQTDDSHVTSIPINRPKYQKVEEWAREQQRFFEDMNELLDPQEESQPSTSTEQKNIRSSAEVIETQIDESNREADEDGKSVSSWIDHVLCERMMCIE